MKYLCLKKYILNLVLIVSIVAIGMILYCTPVIAGDNQLSDNRTQPSIFDFFKNMFFSSNPGVTNYNDPQNSQGSQTYKGEKGDKGDIGPAGPIGPTGPSGPQGKQGPIGSQGERGEKGDTGATGATGPQGEQGIQGIPGETGAQGSQGEQGPPGPKGDTGDAGTQGPQGIPGEQGAIGPKGDTGDTGPQGIQGDPGPNTITTSTTSSITGILAANGSTVILATNNTALSGTQESFTTVLKNGYDWLVTNITSTWKTSVDNHTVSTSNPHNVTKSQIGLDNVPNLDTTNAVNNQHTHSNKSILDATQESFTTSLRTSYDWLVTNITTAWKTTVDTFINSKGQASGLAPLDSNSKVPTVNLGGSGASNSNFLRGDQTWATPNAGGSTPAWKGNIAAAYGDGTPWQMLQCMQTSGVISPTPTNITATVARISYFKLDTALVVNKIRWYGVGAVNAIYHVAIYRDSDSARITGDLEITTAANTWGSISAGGITLEADTLYFLAVSADTTGTTAGILAMGPTQAATTGMMILPTNWPGNLDINMASPKIAPAGFAQFAVTAGALPATAPARVDQVAWTGGMPAFFLDNNNA